MHQCLSSIYSYLLEIKIRIVMIYAYTVVPSLGVGSVSYKVMSKVLM